MIKPILTINELASEYQIPRNALRNLVKEGAFPVIQSGKRIYIARETFEKYLRSGGRSYQPVGK